MKKHLRILVIEDNLGDFILLDEYLLMTELGIESIDHAESLLAGMTLAEEKKPDLILLDLFLPDSTGLDSFFDLNQKFPQIPIIVLSGLEDAKISLESITMGAQDYLIKGEISTQLLKKAIQYSIERKLTEINIQKDLAKATIQGQEKERIELGKELHDNINQVLTAVKLFLNIAASQDSVREVMIQNSSEKVAYCIEEIRKLSKTLLPPSLAGTSLRIIIQELIDTFKETININFEYHFPDYTIQLSETQQINIYRILQEQISNVLKHAKANNVLIRITHENQHINLLIKDDGQGFEFSSRHDGIGLKNIQNRTQVLEGEMEIVSAPNKGCSLSVSFPL